MDSNEETLSELKRLDSLRGMAVTVALVLLVISFFSSGPGIAVLRSFAWTSAGVLSVQRTIKAKTIHLQLGYGQAMIYFAVALLPLFHLL